MEIASVEILKKSVINFRVNKKENISFGNLIQVVFKGSTYYFNVSEIIYNKDSEIFFIKAEQTGSSSDKLSDRLKGQDIFEFCDSGCELITDQSVINGVRHAACLC